MQMMLKVGRKKMVTGLSGGNAVALRVALRSQSARARARRRVQGRLCCLHLFLPSPFSASTHSMRNWRGPKRLVNGGPPSSGVLP